MKFCLCGANCAAVRLSSSVTCFKFRGSAIRPQIVSAFSNRIEQPPLQGQNRKLSSLSMAALDPAIQDGAAWFILAALDRGCPVDGRVLRPATEKEKQHGRRPCRKQKRPCGKNESADPIQSDRKAL